MSGQLVEQWPLMTIEEICKKIFAGGDKPKENFSKTKTDKYCIPIYSNGIKNKGLYGYTDVGKVNEPSLTISARGTIGYSEIREPNYLPIVRLIVLIPNTDIVMVKYLKYFLDSIDISNTGSSIPQLTVPMIREYKIPIMPLEEQHRIVSIIDEAFENISVVLEQSEKELNDSTALFESLLDRTFTQTTKDEKGATVGLWPAEKLSDLCDKIQDGAHKSPKKLYDAPGPNLHPYVTSKNIRTGYLKLDTLQYCDSKFHNEIYPRCNAELGDVLLTKDGASTGNVTINTLNVPFSLLSSVCLFKTNPAKLLPKFLYYYIRSRPGFNQLTGKMTGTAIKRIVLKTIKSSEIPLPTIIEQENTIEFLDKNCEQIDKLTSVYSSKVNHLSELKQSILQEAFNGTL